MPISEGYILDDSIFATFFEYPSDRTGEEMSDCQWVGMVREWRTEENYKGVERGSPVVLPQSGS